VDGKSVTGDGSSQGGKNNIFFQKKKSFVLSFVMKDSKNLCAFMLL
jgi:hypothetical protein